ncbi:LbtU family siderophore porin [Marichromatium bheemlicum]|uniref:LbtU family siderophore porin n=1 Tax=Marichromatium bheemlicum TaxID=365339 RepID=A0ABX1I4Q3_9GAMM|nr:LbtU family siderophore porin [Marichromatium bheemlicum]NKN32123.1 LbtU family siderophore porin [Marichromatium bheemlicum]
MSVRTVSAAITLALAGQIPAHADTLEQRVMRLEQENQTQARLIAEQQAALAGQPERIKRLETTLEDKRMAQNWGGGWFQNIEIAGLIEVEANHTSPYTGSDESDIVLATFELGIAAQVNDWVEANASLLYEEDDTDLEVDNAYVTIANLDHSPLFLSAGQFYVPFGNYESNLISSPLTKEIGETRETSAQFGFVHGDFNGSVYTFNGDRKIDGENEIGSWGANLGFAQAFDDRAWSLGVGYISDLGDSDTLQDVIADNRAGLGDATERTGGWTASAAAAFGPFNLIGEYLAATEEFEVGSLSFEGQGAKPTAWNIEAGYTFEVMGKEVVAAAAYQGSTEALALELPEERWLVGVSVGIFDNTALSLEWSYDTDYDRAEGGTGESANTILAQLAVEF